ncbi:uncharacterized protein [Temnothorax nylanderi]|uniref:uncharacterized protein n=1 Tax=Temnothorax nylanderi TaxID=102681 RepID=UPI003A839CA9
MCRNTTDRTGACYRCGEVGHAARECVSQAHCAVCSDKGLESGHRVGRKACLGGRTRKSGKSPPNTGGGKAQKTDANKGKTAEGKGEVTAGQGKERPQTEKGKKPAPKITSVAAVTTGIKQEGKLIRGPKDPKLTTTEEMEVVVEDKGTEDRTDGVASATLNNSMEINLNHARAAQDLFVQTMAEGGCGLGIIAEPYRVPTNHPCWAQGRSGLSAITWRHMPESSPSRVLEAGEGFVAIQWGLISVVSVYAPPRWDQARFRRALHELHACVRRRLPGRVLVAGDFNAKSTLWGSPATNWRGLALETWAAGLGLCLLNTGREITCVRRQGASIVDLSWANPLAAREIEGWGVVTDQESLSDHLYIEMRVRATPPGLLTRRRERDKITRRWAFKKLDRDLMEAAILVLTWRKEDGDAGEFGEADEEAEGLTETMSKICDVAMPRAFSRAIFAAKETAWKELLASVEEDPWGRHYKLVKDRLRPWAPPLTESLDPQFVDRVIETLFPVGDGGEVRFPETSREWDDELGVTGEELARALKRVRRGKAPGPDGIPGRMWTLAAGGLAGRMRRLYTACLRTGRFPKRWKRASLVLLPKAGKPADSPSGYRPVCLLDEAGKVFKRIIAERLVQHLSQEEDGGLSDDQHGFRAGRYTIDAIKRVLARTEAEIEEGRVVMGISFDVRNAFNSLPWPVLGEALVRFGVPSYLVEVVRDYFRGRGMTYTDQEGILRTRLIGCGVPQGSVLGPLLWNIGYDLVFRTPLPMQCWLSGYADDIYLGVSGEGWRELTRLAETAAASVMRAIRRLGLEVAPGKTEVTVFYNKTRGHVLPPEGLSLRVEGVDVPATPHQKYLGVWLDGQRRFDEHVARVAQKAVGAANARLLPNIGASGRVRRLYVAAVQSVLLYAPECSGVIRKAHTYATDDQISAPIKTWLAHAKERTAKEKRDFKEV